MIPRSLRPTITVVAVSLAVASCSGGHPASRVIPTVAEPATTASALLSPIAETPGTMASPEGTARVIVAELTPSALAVSPGGDVYVADYRQCRIFRLTNDALIPIGGNGTCGSSSGDGGAATAAVFSTVFGMALDAEGNLFLADTANCRIREIVGGIVTTVAGAGTCGYAGDDGPAKEAELNRPNGLALDKRGDLYVSDDYNCRVRVVRGSTITTAVGDGTCGSFGGDGGLAKNAAVEPGGVAVATDGTLYIVDTPNPREQHGPGGACRVRAVRDGIINTVAGIGCDVEFAGDGGPALAASLRPEAVAVDAAGDLYIAGNCRVRVVRLGIIETVAGRGQDPQTACRYSGDGATATSAGTSAHTIAVDANGDLYIADIGNCRVRKVHDGIISTLVAGQGCLG